MSKKGELNVRQARNRLEGEMWYGGQAEIEARSRAILRDIADLDRPIGTLTIMGDLSVTADQEKMHEEIEKRKKELEEELEAIPEKVRQQIAEEIAADYTITDGEFYNGWFYTHYEIERMKNQSDEPEYIEYVYEFNNDD